MTLQTGVITILDLSLSKYLHFNRHRSNKKCRYIPGMGSDDLVNDGDSAVFVTLVYLLGRGVPDHIVTFHMVLKNNTNVAKTLMQHIYFVLNGKISYNNSKLSFV